MIVLFRTRIKELRKAHGYNSQQAFAKAINVTQSTVGNWESGTRLPNWEKIASLSLFFNVSVDYLLGLTDFPCRTTAAVGDRIYALQMNEFFDIYGKLGDDERLIVDTIFKKHKSTEKRKTVKNTASKAVSQAADPITDTLAPRAPASASAEGAELDIKANVEAYRQELLEVKRSGGKVISFTDRRRNGVKNKKPPR